MDKSQREHIRDDLNGFIRGEVLFDDVSRCLYSTDASIFQVEPLGIVVPRDEEDVQALVKYAGANRVPLVPRGAGSGLAGEALGQGLIVDLSRFFRQIVEIGSDRVRVQPGVVLRDLNLSLAQNGRRLAPDPASSAQCTIGGMVATNASGPRLWRHGYMRQYVTGLRLVLDSGDTVEAGRHSRWPRPDSRPGRLEDIVSGVATLLDQNAEVIRTCQPRTPFNRCGYQLHDVLSADDLDLARLVVGTEGTLAIITEATLSTLPLPGGQALLLLAFASLDTAMQAAQLACASSPAACELIDRRLLILVRGSDAEAAALIPQTAEAMLLIEFEADSPVEAIRNANELADRLFQGEHLAVQALVARSDSDKERFWRLREAVLPSLHGLRSETQPVAFIEDVAVPPEHLPLFLHRVQDILKRHETTASFLAHALTGQVHARPFLDLHRPEAMSRLLAITEEVYTLVFELGGSISGQHGTGLARTPWVARQFGPLYAVFRELKAIFDPRHLFNPGKIVGPDSGWQGWPLRARINSQGPPADSHRPQGNGPESLKSKASPDSVPATETPANLPSSCWPVSKMHAEAMQCNGCAYCRTSEASRRMCPIFRFTFSEAATPRAKANLLRTILGTGGDPPLSSEDVRSVCDLCIYCKMCALECPAHVQVPRLMLQAKAANVAQHGLHRTDWALAKVETFARLGSAAAPLVNLALGSRTARWLLEKMFGLSRRRRLPTYARYPFLRRAAQRGWTRLPKSSGFRVAYFVDLFANYHDPLLGEAVVAVLHHNGIEVYVPPQQHSCGMASLAYGDVESARETVQHNLRILAELAREGFIILCSEPTAALMLCQDALDLVQDPDAELVAGRTVELTSFLWDWHRRGRLRTDFQPLPLEINHHVPCHLKALGKPAFGPALLSLIPGLRVHTTEVGCSGMAGTFGMSADNFELSRAAGRSLLDEMDRPGVLHGSTECSACRIQIEDGSGKRTLHPAQYLALAYGLLPELARRLREPIRGLVL